VHSQTIVTTSVQATTTDWRDTIHRFPDEKKILNIIKCESFGSTTIKHFNVNGTVDYGLLQLNSTQAFREVEELIEAKYGKKGQMDGSFGYQGIVMGITAFQTETDKMRDDLIAAVKNKK